MSSDVSDTASTWLEFLAWLETHKRNLVWAGIGGLIIVFVTVVYKAPAPADQAPVAPKFVAEELYGVIPVDTRKPFDERWWAQQDSNLRPAD